MAPGRRVAVGQVAPPDLYQGRLVATRKLQRPVVQEPVKLPVGMQAVGWEEYTLAGQQAADIPEVGQLLVEPRQPAG
jgi:hypothetical protein